MAIEELQKNEMMAHQLLGASHFGRYTSNGIIKKKTQASGVPS
jgi:hypothetical protein